MVAATAPAGIHAITVEQGHGKDFAELMKSAKEAGLFRRQPTYFTIQVIWVLLLHVAVVGILLTETAIWLQLGSAVLLAFAGGQGGFLYHDSGHHQIFKRSMLNDILGHCTAFIIGGNYSWWKDKHNEHHAHPNREDMDPDIDIPVIAFTEEQAREKKASLDHSSDIRRGCIILCSCLRLSI